MNLEALALSRAEEQIASFRWDPDPGDRPRTPRAGQDEINRRRTRCVCGRCKRCKNRRYMRSWRSEHVGERRATCVHCGRARNLHGKKTKREDPLGWCSRCARNNHGAEYRRALRESFFDGGGI